MKFLLTFDFGESTLESDTGAVYISSFRKSYILFLTNLVLCSVGGSDYGSVRIGAFIGKTMIRSFAASFAETNSEEAEEESSELIESDTSLDYLCNLSPHRYYKSLSMYISSVLIKLDEINIFSFFFFADSKLFMQVSSHSLSQEKNSSKNMVITGILSQPLTKMVHTP